MSLDYRGILALGGKCGDARVGSPGNEGIFTREATMAEPTSGG